MSTQRLFVAVDPSPEAVADLRSLVAPLRVSRADAPGRSTRLTRPENWHVTVAFLGDVPSKRVPAASKIVHDVAARFAPLRLRVGGGGTFGPVRAPILWAGIGGEEARLRGLALALREALRRSGFSCDDRPPRPHLTIARPGDRVSLQDVAADIAALDDYLGPEWSATALHLMRSEIEQSPTGPRPRYTAIASAPFGLDEPA